jgi:hypothetical protein
MTPQTEARENECCVCLEKLRSTYACCDGDGGDAHRMCCTCAERLESKATSTVPSSEFEGASVEVLPTLLLMEALRRRRLQRQISCPLCRRRQTSFRRVSPGCSSRTEEEDSTTGETVWQRR